MDFIQDSNQKRQNQKKSIHRFNRRLNFSIRRLNAVIRVWTGSIHRLNRRCLKLTSVQLSRMLVFQDVSSYIHRLNRRYLKLTSVQLSRTLVFQGVSRLYSPVKPTIFEINVGAIDQRVGFSRDFRSYTHRLNRRWI